MAVGKTERPRPAKDGQPYPIQGGQHVVLSLPRDNGCDVIASLPLDEALLEAGGAGDFAGAGSKEVHAIGDEGHLLARTGDAGVDELAIEETLTLARTKDDDGMAILRSLGLVNGGREGRSILRQAIEIKAGGIAPEVDEITNHDADIPIG